MTAKVDQRLWFVVRSSANGKREPRLHFVRIKSRGAKTVTLHKPHWGRTRLKLTELAAQSLYQTTGEALQAFYERALHWRECALDEVAWADRDIAWYRVAPIMKMLRLAREAS